jgi:hypothetical protein
MGAYFYVGWKCNLTEHAKHYIDIFKQHYKHGGPSEVMLFKLRENRCGIPDIPLGCQIDSFNSSIVIYNPLEGYVIDDQTATTTCANQKWNNVQICKPKITSPINEKWNSMHVISTYLRTIIFNWYDLYI